MKGNAYYTEANGSRVVWDNEDLVPTAQLNDQVFVTTAILQTLGQRREICPSTVPCTNTSVPPTCPTPSGESLDFGISTGECTSTLPVDTFCFVQGWCPPENDDTAHAHKFEQIEQMTGFFKVNVEFPDFGIRRNNLPGRALTDGLNLFSIAETLEAAKVNFSLIQNTGAVILATANWNCNFDFPAHKCKPHWSFTRLDIASTLSPGFNYRFARYYYVDNVQYRDLFKAWGIKYVFLNTGTAGKFDIVPLFVNLGAGLALLGISTLLADFVSLHLWPSKNLIHDAKYYDVDLPVESLINEETSLIPEQ